ncbi:hypothetical protein SeMB42_g06770 [Synchytrium endobioticum]|uniref:Uncharacterized protein n=1 Tax=Synchytrium endobioticum TaxID=286115 RepID=A0A507CDQ3_9FUNG|nr:hypothetical protein SeMB42_g06770 [Synchytrium endobioticum]TPX39187.1 hypothetical protein SeLEV6574_g07385 [Synchytrium endobioticum]
MARILPARTGGVVSDAPAKIHGFGGATGSRRSSADAYHRIAVTPQATLPGILPPAAEPERAATPPKPTLMRDDAFTRSVRPGLLKNPPAMSTTPLPDDPVAAAELMHRDPAYWTSLRDPHNASPTSRIVHAPLDVARAGARIQHNELVVVKKEPSGACTQNKPWPNISEPAPSERFKTDNNVRYRYPAATSVEYTHGPIAYSGIAHNYIRRVANNAKSDAEIYRGVHPTVAKHLWLQEKGLHTAKPTQPRYTLQV